MAEGTVTYTGAWEIAGPEERAHVVRLCTALTGNSEVAEDLAQETLLEAWRHLDGLHTPHGRAPWLAAIARNVCLRWARRQGRELARTVRPITREDGAPDGDSVPADALDLEAELERDELAHLLDRALALLPPATRRVLIETYIEESPQAEVAARLGVSEGAVAMRLQRGKLALRRILVTDLRDEAATYGLTPPDAWMETRLWCPTCGTHRFVGGITRETGTLVLRCPSCVFSGVNMVPMERERPLPGARPSGRALTRVMTWADGYFQQALTEGWAACCGCGQPAPLRRWAGDHLPMAVRAARGVHIPCSACGCILDLLLPALALWRPEGRRFWHAHPRLRLLPERDVEADGRPAIVVGFASVTDAATLDIVADRETFRVLRISARGTPSERSARTGNGT